MQCSGGTHHLCLLESVGGLLEKCFFSLARGTACSSPLVPSTSFPASPHKPLTRSSFQNITDRLKFRIAEEMEH